jgi:hypothetical protein
MNLGVEYLYEFLIGSRIADTDTLDPCENSITNFSMIYEIAKAYYNNATTYHDKEEGFFRITDTFNVLTPTTIRCHFSGLYMKQVVATNVTESVIKPGKIGNNAINEFFGIFNAVAA